MDSGMNPSQPSTPGKPPIVVRRVNPSGGAQSLPMTPGRPPLLGIGALIGFSLYVIGAVLYVSRMQWLCAAVLTAGCAGLLYWEKHRWVHLLKIMLIAAALGSVGEWFCVHKFNLWQYHFPVLRDGLPVWIGLVWGYLYAIYILIAEVIDSGWRKFGEPVRNFLAISFGIVFFIFLRQVFLRIDIHISYYYVLFLAVGLSIWRSPLDVLTLIVAGLGGTFGEYLAIQNGLWHYTHPAFPATGMPISLPLAWGLAAVFIRNAALRFRHSLIWMLVGVGVLLGVLRLL